MQDNDYKKSAQWMSEYLKSISTFRDASLQLPERDFESTYLNHHNRLTDAAIESQLNGNLLFSARTKLNNRIEELNKI